MSSRACAPGAWHGSLTYSVLWRVSSLQERAARRSENRLTSILSAHSLFRTHLLLSLLVLVVLRWHICLLQILLCSLWRSFWGRCCCGGAPSQGVGTASQVRQWSRAGTIQSSPSGQSWIGLGRGRGCHRGLFHFFVSLLVDRFCSVGGRSSSRGDGISTPRANCECRPGSGSAGS